MSIGAELVWGWSEELNADFLGRRVRRVEAADRWLLLSFGGQRWGELFFSWDNEAYGCCLMNEQERRTLLAAAKSTPPIFSAIKAHLMGAELTAARRINEDRVLSLDFSKALGAGFNRSRQLIFEPSGRYSNLLLLDEEGKIIEAAKHIYPETNRYRSVFPGLGYTSPPPFEGLALQSFLDSPEPSKLRSVRGIGTPLLSHLAKSAGENPAPYAEELAAFLPSAPPRRWIYQSIGGYVTLFPVPLAQGAVIAADSALIASREACLLPLLGRERDKRRKKLSELLKGRLRNVERKLEEARYFLNESASDPELPRILGTLLLSNIHNIPKGASEATLLEWTQSGEVERTVALDPQKDVPSNAKRYFERYRKQKGARLRAANTLPKLEAEREEILEQQVLLECQENAQLLILLEREITGGVEKGKKSKDKTPQLPPHRRFDLPDASASIYVGLSAKGNHYVTFRLARGEDVWFHAQGIPGAHVILRFADAPTEEERERCYQLAASLAGRYSKGRESGRVRVDHTQKKHVRAIAGAGMANVTYREFGTILADAQIREEDIEAFQV